MALTVGDVMLTKKKMTSVSIDQAARQLLDDCQALDFDEYDNKRTKCVIIRKALQVMRDGLVATSGDSEKLREILAKMQTKKGNGYVQ